MLDKSPKQLDDARWVFQSRCFKIYIDFRQIKLGQFELIQEETPRSHLEPWRDAQSKK